MEDRVLTQAQADEYVARLSVSGYNFAALGGDEPYGFDVYGEGTRYSYRYDATYTTAVALMDRICGALGV